MLSYAMLIICRYFIKAADYAMSFFTAKYTGRIFTLSAIDYDADIYAAAACCSPLLILATLYFHAAV